jgi:hypothetical protein
LFGPHSGDKVAQTEVRLVSKRHFVAEFEAQDDSQRQRQRRKNVKLVFCAQGLNDALVDAVRQKSPRPTTNAERKLTPAKNWKLQNRLCVRLRFVPAAIYLDYKDFQYR